MDTVIYNPRIHYTLKTASKILGLEVYVLRYWRDEGLIELYKNRAGNCFLTTDGMKKVLFVKKCLREDRFTIAGTKELIKTWKVDNSEQCEIFQERE